MKMLHIAFMYRKLFLRCQLFHFAKPRQLLLFFQMSPQKVFFFLNSHSVAKLLIASLIDHLLLCVSALSITSLEKLKHTRTPVADPPPLSLTPGPPQSELLEKNQATSGPPLILLADQPPAAAHRWLTRSPPAALSGADSGETGFSASWVNGHVITHTCGWTRPTSHTVGRAKPLSSVASHQAGTNC